METQTGCDFILCVSCSMGEYLAHSINFVHNHCRDLAETGETYTAVSSLTIRSSCAGQKDAEEEGSKCRSTYLHCVLPVV